MRIVDRLPLNHADIHVEYPSARGGAGKQQTPHVFPLSREPLRRLFKFRSLPNNQILRPETHPRITPLHTMYWGSLKRVSRKHSTHELFLAFSLVCFHTPSGTYFTPPGTAPIPGHTVRMHKESRVKACGNTTAVPTTKSFFVVQYTNDTPTSADENKRPVSLWPHKNRKHRRVISCRKTLLGEKRETPALNWLVL